MHKADLLITNGSLFTADGDPPRLIRGGAVAVAGPRIVWVGSAGEAATWRGPKTEVIDAGGRTVMPGIVDSHFHLLLGSLELDGLQLGAATSLDDLAAMIRDYAAAHPHLRWIVGHQLQYSIIPEDRPLDRHFLDALVPGRGLYLESFDTHTAWANTLALREAGLLHGRETPAGSVIMMDPATGTATGELREPGAFGPVRDLLPVPDAAGKRALLRRGLALAARMGLTSVHNMDGDEEQINLYAALDDLGELSLRVYVPYSVKPETEIEALAEAAEWKRRFTGSHVTAGAIKLFMDGVLESYTGLMLDDYADRPGERGGALFTAEHFKRIAVEADRLGLQIFVHACGDGAVRRTLDGYEHARRVNGPRDSRHRVEHIEVIHPDDVLRFAELGVIASMQPLHAPEPSADGSGFDDVWSARVGPHRWAHSFAWETLRSAGARLAFGSDWPVVSLDPLAGIRAAVNRRPWQPGLPDQRQTLVSALLGYTRDGAYAEFQEDVKGRLRAGFLADVIVLSEDLFACPPEQWRDVRVALTVCDGKIVYRAEDVLS